jgi:hypothetical protein
VMDLTHDQQALVYEWVELAYKTRTKTFL